MARGKDFYISQNRLNSITLTNNTDLAREITYPLHLKQK